MNSNKVNTDATIGDDCRFIEPLDVLFLRGNKLYGEPGSHGESMVLPWPSVAAGALRSQLLANDGIDLQAFASGMAPHPQLGTPTAPGSFALTGFTLGRCQPDQAMASEGEAPVTVEALHRLPADLLVTEDGPHRALQRLRPQALAVGLESSAQLALLPLVAEPERRKPASGYWLRQSGWQRHLQGELPDALTDLLPASALWQQESRAGIGLNPATRSVEDGKLFSAQAVAFKPGVGFVASVRGAQLPAQGMLRLGGDGRAARSRLARCAPSGVDLAQLSHAGRCRVLLTTPGLFAQGWLPDGVTRQADGAYRLALHGVRARLVCASVPRAEVVSGWDLARWQPKQALRAVPAGSVYWLDQLQGSADDLGKLAKHGFWRVGGEDLQRRAEGFNRFAFAAY